MYFLRNPDESSMRTGIYFGCCLPSAQHVIRVQEMLAERGTTPGDTLRGKGHVGVGGHPPGPFEFPGNWTPGSSKTLKAEGRRMLREALSES